MNADDPSEAARKLCQEIRDAISNAPPPPSLTDTLADASRRLIGHDDRDLPQNGRTTDGRRAEAAPGQVRRLRAEERRSEVWVAFQLKSGRQSPYFFNAGLVCDGNDAAEFFDAYAAAIQNSGLEFDVVFGPAYKGIPFMCRRQCCLAARGVSSSFRLQPQGGQGPRRRGTLVGAAVKGRRVLLVDDVISAGTAVREATGILAKAGAILVGVCVAVDRQEVTGGSNRPRPVVKECRPSRACGGSSACPSCPSSR